MFDFHIVILHAYTYTHIPKCKDTHNFVKPNTFSYFLTDSGKKKKSKRNPENHHYIINKSSTKNERRVWLRG